MRVVIWDVLAVLTLLGIAGMTGAYGIIFINPQVSFNPFPPPTMPAVVGAPPATPPIPGFQPTWTPVSGSGIQQPVVTVTATATLFILPSRTPSLSPTPTQTLTATLLTPTITGTIPTETPTITLTPTLTVYHSPTLTPTVTDTLVPSETPLPSSTFTPTITNTPTNTFTPTNTLPPTATTTLSPTPNKMVYGVAGITKTGFARLLSVFWPPLPTLTSPNAGDPTSTLTTHTPVPQDTPVPVVIPLIDDDTAGRRMAIRGWVFSDPWLFAYEEDNQIMLMPENNPGGAYLLPNQQAGFNRQPAVSAGGSRLVYTNVAAAGNPDVDPHDIYLTNRDGLGLLALAVIANDEYAPSWVGDYTVLYVRDGYGGQGWGPQIHRVEADGTNDQRITENAGTHTVPQYCGGYVAYGLGTDIYIGTLNNLQSDSYNMPIPGAFPPDFSWGPGCLSIVYNTSSGVYIQRLSSDGSGSMAWPPSLSGNPILVTDTSGGLVAEWAENEQYPLWKPLTEPRGPQP